jgi:hypothetical protein
MSTITINVPSRKSRLVAVKPGKDHAVVAHGNKLSVILAKAKKAGISSPAIIWVPDPRKRYIF